MTTVITISLPLQMEIDKWRTKDIVRELNSRLNMFKEQGMYGFRIWEDEIYINKTLRVSKELGDSIRELAAEEGLSILELTKRLW